ncbi:MAG TPA: sugar ABC transporter permease [Mycobacterium sp.]|nr:sugar ABC transporter permease [Mycobacterium sp.]
MADAPRRSTALGYALLAPSLFGVVAFLLLPILVVVWLSLYRWDLLGPLRYVGLANWRAVLADADFGNSLIVTAVFVAIVVPAQTVLGLLAASMLARELRGTGVFRTLYVLPWICAPLAIAVLWRWILAPTDGATAWQRFWRITLPMLRPTTFFVLVTGIVSSAQVFDTVYALTGGGPKGRTDLVAHRIYAEAFGSAAIGRAAVMAVALFVILVGVTAIQHLYFRRRISYDLT